VNRRTILQILTSVPLLNIFVRNGFTRQQASSAPRAERSSSMIHLGTHYEYPFGGGYLGKTPWRSRSPSDWKRDIASIRQTGFDVFRMRIGFDSKLDEVEQLLNIAGEMNIKVHYGFATFYAPDWFTQRYPDSRVVTAKGEVLGNARDTRWPRACIEHPAYRELWRNVVEESARRFKDHPAILGWDIHNEPFNVCYNDLCKRLFREHLQQKYRNVEKANEAWGTTHKTLDECAQPPHEPVSHWGSGTGGLFGGAGPSSSPTTTRSILHSHWGAWRQFQADRMSDFLNEGMDLIHKHVTDRHVTYNVAWNLDRGADWWNTRQCDMPAKSAYYGSDAYSTGRYAEMAFLAAINPGKELWALETLGGPPSKAWNVNLWTGKNLEIEMWSLLGNGAKAVIQYKWEPILAENETLMYATVDVDSDNTEKRARMQQAIHRTRELQSFLRPAKLLSPQIRFYFPRRHYTEAVLSYPGFPDGAWIKKLGGWYALLTHAGYRVAFLCYPETGLPQEQIIFIPFSEFLDENEWSRLESFTSQGGRVILQISTEGIEAARKVAEKLGLSVEEVEARARGWMVDGWVLTKKDGKNAGAAYINRVAVSGAKGIDVLARYYDNNRPALITQREGRWLISTFDVGHSYNWTLRKELRQAIASWIRSVGLEPKIKVEGIDEDYRPMVEVNALEHDGKLLLICCNRSPYQWELTVRVDKYAPASVKFGPFEARQVFTRR